MVNRNDSARVMRNDQVLHTGKLTSLKRFQDDVREVAMGFECGIGLGNIEIAEGDVIECFEVEHVRRTL